MLLTAATEGGALQASLWIAIMKWVIDMTCSYLDHEGNVLLVESIPQAG